MPRSARLDAELPDPDLHLEFAARQLADPCVAAGHGGPRTRGEVRRMLLAQAEQEASSGFCLWWWRERRSGELVGYVGLNRDRIGDERVVEVGWSITPARWGEGLAPEAARATLRWGFERAGLERIVSFALLDNLRSRRVMEKIGMEYAGEIERAGLPHALYATRR